MKNIIRTLSLALTFGLFLNAAQPAHADFFPEPFGNGSAAATVKTQSAQPSVETVLLQVNTTTPVKAQAVDPWSAPLSNPTPYVPMLSVQPAASAISAQASAPIAIPLHDSGNSDTWSTPLGTSPYVPMR